MNNISEQLLQAIDIITDQKVAELQFDKTIQAKIYSLVDVDTGEYKVKYNSNIFSAFSNDIKQNYKIDEPVYVIIPEGNFSARKVITGSISSQSLSYNQLAALQNSILEISPEFNSLYSYNKNSEYGVIAGAPLYAPGSYNYIYNGPDSYSYNSYHGVFQRYANNYELIRIQADFNTRFYDVHLKGNYGIEIEFYAKGDEIVSYKLDLNAFNGDPYSLTVYSPQSTIIKVQKNYLLGLKSIKLFEEDFVYDRIIENGLVTDKENTADPNIFVKNISLQYVEQKDLTDTNYYLMISAPQGIAFTPNISSLELIGRLVYQGKDIMDNKKCECQWFVRDLTVMVGDERYNKNAGFGWAPIPQATSNLLALDISNVAYEQRYKLLVVYNKDTILQAEIEVFNNTVEYSYGLEQHTDGADISLQLINYLENGDLVGDWYLSYPDNSYIEFTDGKQKNSIIVSEYLKYSSVIFYCQIYNFTRDKIIGTVEHTISNSESDGDVTISYDGEDSFRYDSNGDITIEDSEKERTLQAILTWKEGFGTAYTIQWLYQDADGKEIVVPTYKTEGPPASMIEEFWVDNSNILHYNIRQKYKTNSNNNVLIVKITTITEEEYKFEKEILFVKDGDQGTNGTTYVVAIRPCDSNGIKLSGLRPLIYNGHWQNVLPLKCYVYKDGTPIKDGNDYIIRYKWEGINISFAESEPTDTVTARGIGNPNALSASNELQFYVKVEVDINDRMNGNTTSIYASYPIDVAVGGIDYSLVNIDSIPSYIKYTASGLIPKFYSNAIKFLYNQQDRSSSISSMNTNILNIESKDGQIYLKPATNFIAENVKNASQSNIGVLKCALDINKFLIHPVIMYLDTYGNEAINGWDGEALKLDDNGNYIFAPQIGAGEKDSQNRFTGVVMGKDSGQDKIGLYGYQLGVNTFGLMQNGKAFFGAKSGGGQIVLDGRHATIFGGDVTLNESSGKITPAENGMYLVLADKKVDGEIKAVGIGYNGREENFFVRYNGELKATGADIQGAIYANSGQIGGTARSGGWTIVTNQLYSGSGSTRVALDSNKDNPFSIWAGASSGGDSYNPNSATLKERISRPAKFVVTKDGFVYMRDCYIKGGIETGEGIIAGWTISSNRLVSNNGTTGIATNGTYRFWSGASPMFNPSRDDPQFAGSTYFYVTSGGKLCCRDADIRGKIEAESGKIGNWIISGGKLSNGSTTLTETGKIITNTIEISGYGYLGQVNGNNGETVTENLGLKSTSQSIIVESAFKFVRIQGFAGLYLVGDKGIHVSGGPLNIKVDNINFERAGNITLNGTSIDCNIPASRQTGIYARFA